MGVCPKNCIIIFLLFITGCSAIFKSPSDVPLESISLISQSDSNNFFATALDLVVVFDKDLAAKLTALPATKYFQIADQLKHDNNENLIKWRWEVVPGQVIAAQQIYFEKDDPVAAFLFAQYYSKGDHRIKLPQARRVAVFLERNEFKIKEVAEEDQTQQKCAPVQIITVSKLASISPKNNKRVCDKKSRQKAGSLKGIAIFLDKDELSVKEVEKKQECVKFSNLPRFSRDQPCSSFLTKTKKKRCEQELARTSINL